MAPLHQSLLCTCHGKAKSLLDNGEVHKFEFVGGHVYEGKWMAGKPHGAGRFKWKDGGVYVGNFVSGEMEGEGKMTYKDGTVYEGDFVGSLPEGTCKVSFPSVEKEGGGQYPGATFKGTCKRGEAEGTGIFSYPVSDDREGHWSAGALAYEEGSESTWDQGAHGMVGISGASAAAMGQEVPLSLDMRSLKRQKPRAPHDDAENVILRGAMGEPSYSVKENDGEIMEPRTLPGFSDVHAEALGEGEVKLELGMRSMTRKLKGDAVASGDGSSWNDDH